MRSCMLLELVIAISRLISPAWSQLSSRALMEMALLGIDDVRYELVTSVSLTEAVQEVKKDWKELEVGSTAGRSLIVDVWSDVIGVWTQTWKGMKKLDVAIKDGMRRAAKYVKRVASNAVKTFENITITDVFETIGDLVVRAPVMWLGDKIISGLNEYIHMIRTKALILRKQIEEGASAWELIKTSFDIANSTAFFVMQKVIDYYEAAYVDSFIDTLSLIFEAFVWLRKKVDDNYRVVYENPMMGQLDRDDPIMNFGYKPDLEKDVRVIMRLQNTFRCPNNKSEVCLKHMEIDIDRMNEEEMKMIPKCDHLTVTIHGWREGPNHALSEALGQFYSSLYDSFCNLDIDWTPAASGVYIWQLHYHKEAANTVTIGRKVAIALFKMIYFDKVEPSEIHIIGNTLGAHVAHFASEWLVALGASIEEDNPKDSWLVGRITGLDPASYYFEDEEGTYLNQDDADFVDVIHTSAVAPYENAIWNFIRGRFGMSEDIGHIDFYPNRGTHPQRESCNELQLFGQIEHLIKLGVNYLDAVMCSSGVASEYFIKSLKSYNGPFKKVASIFPAFPCESVWELEPPEGHFDSLASPNNSAMGIQSVAFKGRGRFCLSVAE